MVCLEICSCRKWNKYWY